MPVDFKVVQLLCSRLCHDLVGPVGAVNTGLELMAETGTGREGIADALGLVTRSAKVMAQRVSFYRMALGFGAGGQGSIILGKVRELTADFLGQGRTTVDWPLESDADGARVISETGAKIVLNLVLIGIEALPRGGVLTVRCTDLSEGSEVAVTAAGSPVRLKDDLRAALAGEVPPDDLTTGNVHGQFTYHLVDQAGARIQVTDGAGDEVSFVVLLQVDGAG